MVIRLASEHLHIPTSMTRRRAERPVFQAAVMGPGPGLLAQCCRDSRGARKPQPGGLAERTSRLAGNCSTVGSTSWPQLDFAVSLPDSVLYRESVS